mmetsp:Transcript_105681/g.268510  ORF Transcript_105681/g.268510 Transcript_105681/m.268510 type:complete len:215 (-) Transcript_105681:589-1233(-)
MAIRMPSLLPSSVCSHVPVCVFQTLARPSPQPVTANLLSGDSATAVTGRSWPCNVRRQRPLCRSQIFAVPSLEPVSSSASSTECATQVTVLVCASQVRISRPVRTLQSVQKISEAVTSSCPFAAKHTVDTGRGPYGSSAWQSLCKHSPDWTFQTFAVQSAEVVATTLLSYGENLMLSKCNKCVRGSKPSPSNFGSTRVRTQLPDSTSQTFPRKS